ncbi:hypothetical protein J6590_014254 [Homalodisca vitripennis]|nr:hypothetical protein J6590_014254 [Homalodisca vitripennis]
MMFVLIDVFPELLEFGPSPPELPPICSQVMSEHRRGLERACERMAVERRGRGTLERTGHLPHFRWFKVTVITSPTESINCTSTSVVVDAVLVLAPSRAPFPRHLPPHLPPTHSLYITDSASLCDPPVQEVYRSRTLTETEHSAICRD